MSDSCKHCGDNLLLKAFEETVHPACVEPYIADLTAKLEAAEAREKRLREALRGAIEGYEECAGYKGDHLYKKHRDAEEIARLKAALEN